MKKISINIWDDYDDENSEIETYAYVEESNMDYELRKKYLEEFSNLFSEVIEGSSIESKLIEYDSRIVYPNLDESFHFSRPQLMIKNMNHDFREVIVRQLQSIESIFNIYSES